MSVKRRGNSYVVRVYNRTTKKKDWIGSFSFDKHGGQREAEIAAKRAELEAKESPIRFGRETCESFAARYLDDYNRSTKGGSTRWGEKTKRDMASAFKPFVAAFGPRRMNSLTTPEVRSWAQGQPYNYAKVVRTMFNDAVLDGLIGSNPFSNLRLEQPKGRRDLVVLTEPEIEDLCDTALEVWPEFGPTIAAMIATAAYTGIRPGEMFALRPDSIRPASCELDVKLSYNGVELKKPKNGKERNGIILPPQASARIERMPRKLRSEWLFEAPRSQGRFRKSTLDYYFRSVKIAAGRPKMVFYELRHAAATLLLERGVSVEDVAWQLGHTDGGRLVATLYGHPSEAGRRERIKRAFGQNVAPLREAGEEAANG